MADPKPATAAPKKRKLGRPSHITDELWGQLRSLYEAGNYSQRQLCDFANMRGVKISQAAIARKAMDEGWVKGSRSEEIREQVMRDLKSTVGEELGKMLTRHADIARTMQQEIMQHLIAVRKRRETAVKAGLPPDDITIPAALLRQLVGGYNEAIVMEARALGFDYRTGKPFTASDDDEREAPQTLTIRTLTDEEQEAIRKDAETDPTEANE